jgi:hypothetical protein
MMKRIIYAFGLLVVTLLPLVAGFSCSSQIGASPGQEFTLPIGKTAVIIGEDLSLKFVDVTADSRCPAGVVCVWAGEAKCWMSVTYQGSESDVFFTQPGSSEGAEDLFQQYRVSFKLEPYPESGQQINKSDYKLVMTIIK